MPYSQDNKLISIDTPLGEDALLLTAFSGEEGLSRGFRFELEMVSENHTISFESIIDVNVTIAIKLADGNNRYINGIISSFTQSRGGGEGGGDAWFTYYRTTMVPWFWVLTKTADSRIFQNLTAIEIVEKVFRDQGFSDYRLDLQSNYDKREFCVQYRETAHNFVSRLLEEEGIFYYFEHETGKHIMVLGDSPIAHKPCPGQKAASSQLSGQGVREEDVITALEMTQQVCTSKYSLNDFNFKLPNSNLGIEVQGHDNIKLGNRNVHDYPGKFTSRAAGDRIAKIGIEEEEAQSVMLSGTSDCRSFASGFRFTLKDHACTNLNNKDYVLLSVTHKATEGYAEDAGAIYENTFECLSHSVPYRPSRVTPKPVVPGTQTAVVVGPSGEEIYTDEHGRVKVQFHWDREGKKDDNSSCWIRVSQSWAGNGWGGMYIPRVGQEVIVAFLEGDPDQPIIIGQVYNGVNLPPYPLPGEKTKSSIRSNSTPGGDGFNEIRFEDKKGQEHVFIHAEKQQENRVKEDGLEWIGQDRHLIVVRHQFEKVSGDQHLTVGGDRNEKVDGTVSLTVSEDLQQKVGARHALEAGQEIHLKAGMRVIVESGTQISLKVGENFINIGPAGVTIVGTMVLINSGGSAGAGLGASPEMPKAPKEASAADPGNSNQPLPPPKPIAAGAQATALKAAAARGTPYCDT